MILDLFSLFFSSSISLFISPFRSFICKHHLVYLFPFYLSSPSLIFISPVTYTNIYYQTLSVSSFVSHRCVLQLFITVSTLMSSPYHKLSSASTLPSFIAVTILILHHLQYPRSLFFLFLTQRLIFFLSFTSTLSNSHPLFLHPLFFFPLSRTHSLFFPSHLCHAHTFLSFLDFSCSLICTLCHVSSVNHPSRVSFFTPPSPSDTVLIFLTFPSHTHLLSFISHSFLFLFWLFTTLPGNPYI